MFRPSVNLKIGRVEKDASKITALYALGLKDAKERMGLLKKFLGI